MHPKDNSEALLRVLAAPRRNQYFYGKRMDVQHFGMEQDYGKLKQWLVNRLSLGKGVMCGLKVTVDGTRLCVDPGVAIDGLGREIVVPVHTCIDPLAPDDGCCGSQAATPAPSPAPPAQTPPPVAPSDPAGPTAPPNPALYTPPAAQSVYKPGQAPIGHRAEGSVFTLWLCYRECTADYQPVLVSDCDSRSHCAGGTTVETFCLKVTPGLAPLQRDPHWCANLWGSAAEPRPHSSVPAPPAAGTIDQQAPRQPIAARADVLTAPAAKDDIALTEAELMAVVAARHSRRHLLCELFDAECGTDDGDPCVPLALVRVRDGRLVVEACVVRPRIYSNQQLLDLILCLAEKIDDCCNGKAPTPPTPQPPTPPAALLRVRSIEFLHRDAASGEKLVGQVASPLTRTNLQIDGRTNAIRIRFNRPVEQRATHPHRPDTAGIGDNDFERHNVLVLPDGSGTGALPYVPGTLVLEQPDTLRFDLALDSLYSRGVNGWQKGRYLIVICGTDDANARRMAVVDAANGQALDGEAIVPAGGLISGDGTPGGDFKAGFNVG